MADATDEDVLAFIEAVDTRRRDEARSIAARLEERLMGDAYDDLSPRDLDAVVTTMTQKRLIDEADTFLEAMAVAKRMEPVHEIARAQVSIEQNRQAAAIPVLERLADKYENDPTLFAEAKGIGGRAHKDLFLKSLRGNRNAAEHHLHESMRNYSEGLSGDPLKHAWLAGNLLGLEARARVEGFGPPDGYDRNALIRIVEEQVATTDPAKRSFYDWSSLAEAKFAKQDWAVADDAVNHLLRYTKANVFELNNTVRQYKEIWELHKKGPKASFLLSELEQALMATTNGSVTLDLKDMARHDALDLGDREAQFDHHQMRSHQWIDSYRKMGESVLSVVDKNTGIPRGTCLVINGSEIDKRFEGQLLGLTNDHVISPHPELYVDSYPLRPEAAAIHFALSDDPMRKYFVGEVLWSSPYQAHDTCLFTFATDILPVAHSRLRIVNYLPPAPAMPKSEVFLISHPQSDQPSFSFQNTELLAHDYANRGKDTLLPGYLQYSTGSVKGSSGGVALNASLEMIGLHHAGSNTMRRLDKEGETHPANEAVWITAIINAIRHDLERGVDRWEDAVG